MTIRPIVCAILFAVMVVGWVRTLPPGLTARQVWWRTVVMVVRSAAYLHSP